MREQYESHETHRTIGQVLASASANACLTAIRVGSSKQAGTQLEGRVKLPGRHEALQFLDPVLDDDDAFGCWVSKRRRLNDEKTAIWSNVVRS